ncbi:hypothetical protein [Nonomuraea sp. NPDC049141]|uniref:hypothetical protein n=1 Tax=Nonomuraea sp. NPDC049141 TaxID=3155500 RepID=UPI0033D60DE5
MPEIFNVPIPKVPVPGGTPSPYESGGGGDLRWMQLTTLSEYAFANAIFPVLQNAVLTYGLTMYADPQLLHRASDGWGAVSSNLSASGQSMQDEHDSVPAVSWQALDRAAFGQKVSEYATDSQAGAHSASFLSVILRLLADALTVWIYFSFTFASSLAMLALSGAFTGGGGKIFEIWRAHSMAVTIETRFLMLRRLLAVDLFALLVECGVAFGYDKIMTDGLK